MEHDLRLFGDQLYGDMLSARRSFDEALHETSQRYKKHFAKTMFAQRVGWQRLRHSVRDFAGLSLGIWLAFRGHSNTRLNDGGGAEAIEFVILLWDFLAMSTIDVKHEPWLLDAVSSLAGLSLWKLNNLAKGRLGNSVSVLFIGHSAFHCAGIILTEWYELANPILLSWLATALSFAILQTAQVPHQLAASSISGAILAYESARSDFASNWFWMLEIASGLVYRFGPFLRSVILKMVNNVRRTWRLRWKEMAPSCVSNFVSRGTEVVNATASFVWKPVTSVRSTVSESTLFDRVQTFSNRLRQAIRPILWPWSISIWGTAVQLDRINDIGSIWRYYRMTWDPVSFAVRRVVNAFSIRTYSRRAFLTWVRNKKRQCSTFTR